eukprot:CAMPEP_0114527070 /NCGR_PEP_ID=MMETSP0109-20121206/23402_1 /TAXON_ID=29199 /ORGANISM="Chlorarachnion reptans, Strain CCCM449" /LENGTH=475 /DNA_ID=CAMNT_0001708975 /DNA_START=1195 /DNA_END=2622 /DNA_ORIENTATION=+
MRGELRPVAENLDEQQAVLLQLLYEKRQQKASNWSTYLSTLPNSMTGHPLMWEKASVVAYLGDTIASNTLLDAQSTVRKDFEKLVAAGAESILPNLTLSEALWGSAVIASRGFRLRDLNGKGGNIVENVFESDGRAVGELALVPWADLLNHSPHVGQAGILHWESGSREYAVLNADSEYRIGEQVFDSYGQNLSPIDAFIHYGFSVDVVDEQSARSPSLAAETPGLKAWLPIRCIFEAIKPSEAGKQILELVLPSRLDSVWLPLSCTSDSQFNEFSSGEPAMEWSFDLGSDDGEDLYVGEDELEYQRDLEQLRNEWERGEADDFFMDEESEVQGSVTSDVKPETHDLGLALVKVLLATESELTKLGWDGTRDSARAITTRLTNSLRLPEGESFCSDKEILRSLELRTLDTIVQLSNAQADRYARALRTHEERPDISNLRLIDSQAINLLRSQLVAFRLASATHDELRIRLRLQLG